MLMTDARIKQQIERCAAELKSGGTLSWHWRHPLSSEPGSHV